MIPDDAGLRALAPMYIVNPLRGIAQSSLFGTHPPTEQRVEILRSMAGAGWRDYERAYRKVIGWNETCLDESLWKSEEAVPLGEGSSRETVTPTGVGLVQEVTDLLDRKADFLPIRCSCGVRIKVPSDFKHDTIDCPRCGRTHDVPHAAGPRSSEEGAPLEYRKIGQGWDSFRCSCGKVMHLSPAVRVERLKCHKCGASIHIV